MVVIRELGPGEASFPETCLSSLLPTQPSPNVPSLSLASPPFRMVQELRREQVKRSPSVLQQKKVNDAYKYVTRNVDPVMSRVISELVVHKPENVALAMLNYFQWREEGCPATKERSNLFKLKRGAEKEDRLYAVRHVTPLLSELMLKLAQDQPSDLNNYVIKYLTEYMNNRAAAAEASAAATTKPMRRTSAAPTGAGALANEGPVTAVLEAQPKAAAAAAPMVLLKTITVVVLGLDGSGKSSLLATLQGDKDPNPLPTTGFRPVQMVMEGGVKVRFYDLGGGNKIRDIWENYFHDVHAVLYALNSSEEGEGRWEEAIQLLNKSRQHKYLSGKPLLVLATKQDKTNARPMDDVHNQLGMGDDDDCMMMKVLGCVVPAKSNGNKVDHRIDEGLRWLFERVQERAEELQGRLKQDMADAEARNEKMETEKKKTVLKDLMAKACSLGSSATTCDDCFSEQQGLEFLAAELGEEIGHLELVAKEIAAMVGYQKLALQMVGNMKCPISRKKKAWEWPAIRAYVVDLRRELGLDEIVLSQKGEL